MSIFKYSIKFEDQLTFDRVSIDQDKPLNIPLTEAQSIKIWETKF